MLRSSLVVLLASSTLTAASVACSGAPEPGGEASSSPEVNAGSAKPGEPKPGSAETSSGEATTDKPAPTGASASAAPKAGDPAECGAAATKDACSTCCGVTELVRTRTKPAIAACTCEAAKKCSAGCAAEVCAPHPDGASGMAEAACIPCTGIDSQCADDVLDACFADPACSAVIACSVQARCEAKP